jgi:AraC-like DNA-binding protein
MATTRAHNTDISWLSELAEYGPALDEFHPIWVRHVKKDSGAAVSPPHRHAYCECEILLSGSIIQHVEREEISRDAGSVFLAGPGVPHWSTVVKYPVEYFVVYFKPWILIGNTVSMDAGQILQRFTARQPLNERLIQPPTDFENHIRRTMESMLREFDSEGFGRELKLVSMLNSLLVDLWRWEYENGHRMAPPKPGINWHDLEAALNFIHLNYAKQLYARDVANAARLSESNLEVLFRDALEMPWVRYLQRYRVQQSAVLLMEGKLNVSETAESVGFNSLSHFNSVFKSVMGVSPSQYAKQARG